MMNLRSHLRRAGTALFLVWPGLAVPLSGLHGQQDVVFLHGLGQTAAAWISHANELSTLNPEIAPVPITTGSNYVFPTQASILSYWLGREGVNGAPAISHSNGGLVAREYVRAGGTRLNGHLSLGTPHLGAPLADNLALLGVDLFWMAVQNLDNIMFFRNNDPDFRWSLDGDLAMDKAAIIEDAAILLGPILVEEAFWEFSGTPFNRDLIESMKPGSPFLTTLNDSPALAEEAGQLDARVSISTQYPPNLLPWRYLYLNPHDPLYANVLAQLWDFQREDLMELAWDYYFYYLSHPNWNLSSNAYRWLEVFDNLAVIPGLVQEAIGAQIYGGSDGVVPWVSSEYPENTRTIKIYDYEDYLFHTDQLAPTPGPGAPIIARMLEVIEQDFGITPQVLPSPLSVQIIGPREVPEGRVCEFEASVSGGSGGYSYQWSGVLNGTSSWVAGEIWDSGNLYLTVTSGGAQATARVFVTIIPDDGEELGGGAFC